MTAYQPSSLCRFTMPHPHCAPGAMLPRSSAGFGMVQHDVRGDQAEDQLRMSLEVQEHEQHLPAPSYAFGAAGQFATAEQEPWQPGQSHVDTSSSGSLQVNWQRQEQQQQQQQQQAGAWLALSKPPVRSQVPAACMSLKQNRDNSSAADPTTAGFHSQQRAIALLVRSQAPIRFKVPATHNTHEHGSEEHSAADRSPQRSLDPVASPLQRTRRPSAAKPVVPAASPASAPAAQPNSRGASGGTMQPLPCTPAAQQPEQQPDSGSHASTFSSYLKRAGAEGINMITPELDPWKRRWSKFISYNGLVHDPEWEHRENIYAYPWTPEEDEAFIKAYFKKPKDFEYILSQLPLRMAMPRRSLGEVINHFYRVQWKPAFAKMHRQKVLRRRARSGEEGRRWHRHSAAEHRQLLHLEQQMRWQGLATRKGRMRRQEGSMWQHPTHSLQLVQPRS